MGLFRKKESPADPSGEAKGTPRLDETLLGPVERRHAPAAVVAETGMSDDDRCMTLRHWIAGPFPHAEAELVLSQAMAANDGIGVGKLEVIGDEQSGYELVVSWAIQERFADVAMLTPFANFLRDLAMRYRDDFALHQSAGAP